MLGEELLLKSLTSWLSVQEARLQDKNDDLLLYDLHLIHSYYVDCKLSSSIALITESVIYSTAYI